MDYELLLDSIGSVMLNPLLVLGAMIVLAGGQLFTRSSFPFWIAVLWFAGGCALAFRFIDAYGTYALASNHGDPSAFVLLSAAPAIACALVKAHMNRKDRDRMNELS